MPSHYSCSRHWRLGHPRASSVAVLNSITVCNFPPLNHLTDCNTIYDLPGTAFPDYILQFITFSLSSLFILSPAHYLRPNIKRNCNFTSLENFQNAIIVLFFFLQNSNGKSRYKLRFCSPYYEIQLQVFEPSVVFFSLSISSLHQL